MSDLKAFKTWLAENDGTLSKRTPQEIARLALVVGFERQTVNQWLISQTFKKGPQV